jgi:hypothetical protein
MVAVTHAGGDDYEVQIAGRTQHTVTVPPGTMRRLLKPGESPEHGIERVMRFLLDREPPESIMRRFTLDDVVRYFPEFWSRV